MSRFALGNHALRKRLSRKLPGLPRVLAVEIVGGCLMTIRASIVFDGDRKRSFPCPRPMLRRRTRVSAVVPIIVRIQLVILVLFPKGHAVEFALLLEVTLPPTVNEFHSLEARVLDCVHANLLA